MKRLNCIFARGLLSLLLVTLVGCRSTNTIQVGKITATPILSPTTTVQNTEIDWVDFLKLNGVSYTGSQHEVLTDSSKLGEEIGSIAFQVANHVHDPHYVTKDGDAAFLAKGTVVRAIEGYPNHEIVAVQDASNIGGYKLYIANDKRNQLELTFKQAVENKIVKVALYSSNGIGKPIVELKDGSQIFIISMLQQTAKEETADVKLGANPVYYRFVVESGMAVSFSDNIYKVGNNYYWNYPNMKQLSGAFAYYFANERDVVFTIQGIDFPLPNHADTLATGERIKRNGDSNNITLIGVDGMTERTLFSQESIDQLWKKAREVNPSEGEDKPLLYMADRAMPVNNGQLIAYVTNKDTIVKRKNGGYNVNLIHLDGKGDRMIVDGSKYGGLVLLLDSVGDRIVAEGGDYSLLDINISTGKVRHFPIHGILDALSVDGKYVLYRKMLNDSLVGREIVAFDLDTTKIIELGIMPENYIFAQGIK